MGEKIGFQIGYENWTRRAWVMLKELGDEYDLDTRKVIKTSTYKEWAKYFDPQWEEAVWDKWQLAMLRECKRMNRKKYHPVRVFAGIYRRLIK